MSDLRRLFKNNRQFIGVMLILIALDILAWLP